MALIALDEAKAQLKITGDAEDTMLLIYIGAATEVVERHTGKTTEATPPANYKLAGLIILQHLWSTRRGNMPTATPELDISMSYPNFNGYAIPNKAIELLGPPAPWVL